MATASFAVVCRAVRALLVTALFDVASRVRCAGELAVSVCLRCGVFLPTPTADRPQYRSILEDQAALNFTTWSALT